MSEQHEQELTVVIDAPIETCFEVITDFESYPEWNAQISATEVEKSSRGAASQVAFEIDAMIKTIRYVLAYKRKKPNHLSWQSVGGDVSNITGSYRFAKLDDERTEATCRQEVELGFWLPGPIRRMAEASALEQSVGEFKQEAERRYKSAQKSGKRSKRG